MHQKRSKRFVTVRTWLMQPPRQLERWQLLPESALCERVIAYLDVNIVPQTSEDQNSRNSYHIASLLTAIARKSPRVETTLRLTDNDLTSTQAATGIVFPRVCRAIVSSCSERRRSSRSESWSVLLGGRIFPDLRQLETNGFPRESRDLTARPLTIEEQLSCAEDVVHKFKHLENFQPDASFEGLKHLQTLKIEGDVTLNQPLLLSLLGSVNVPAHLTSLEIAYCPNLLFAKNATTWSTLLQRSLTTLPELRKLKLHIMEDPYEKPSLAYPHFQGPPSAHFCDFVRLLGQNIQHLDLALPFACRRMFLPPKPSSHYTYSASEQRGAPGIPREPLMTLPQRLIDQGFQYRRLICWEGICYEHHDWNAMAPCAGAQGTEYSWEIVNDVLNKASWHVGLHDAVHFRGTSVVEQPY